MTQDEIIRMAREAGLQLAIHAEAYPVITQQLERFAALVAAHERNRLAWTQEHWTQYEHAIAAAEREACAKVCETDELCCKCGDECAAVIRARGEK